MGKLKHLSRMVAIGDMFMKIINGMIIIILLMPISNVNITVIGILIITCRYYPSCLDDYFLFVLTSLSAYGFALDSFPRICLVQTVALGSIGVPFWDYLMGS